jgi:hypothetical protein
MSAPTVASISSNPETSAVCQDLMKEFYKTVIASMGGKMVKRSQGETHDIDLQAD